MTGSDRSATTPAAAWERAAPDYESAWRPVTGLFVPPLLDAARATPGARLLDLASGPGLVAEEALRRGCRVVGADFSCAMIRLARAQLPRACFAVADAHASPFAEARFDAVAINFGVHHFDDPAAALGAVAVALRPGGRVAYTVWAAVEKNPALEELERAFAEIQENSGPQVPAADFPFGDSRRFRDALARLGYDSEAMELARVTRHWRPEKPEDVFEAELRGGGRATELLARQTPAVLEALRAAVVAAVRRFETRAGIAIPMTAYVISAERRGTGRSRADD